MRINARPLALAYRPLPCVRYMGVIQPNIRTFSSTWIKYNKEQLASTINKVTPIAKEELKPLTTETTTEKVAEQVAEQVVTKAPTSRIGKFIQQSKDLIRFYKDGLKLLWTNNKEAKALKLKVQNEGYELTRREFQLIHKSKKDMIKLIPFGCVFMILPESIPLLVMYVPGMVPGTCLKDSQIQKTREKLDKVRQLMSANVLKSAERIEGISPEDFLSLSKFQRIAKHYAYDFDLSRIDRAHLSSYCRFMGINRIGTQSILKKRLEDYMNYLDQDDKLLLKEDVDQLDLKDLSQAVEERGMRSVDLDQENMRRGLKYWLSLTQPANPEHKIPAGLLVFSRMFLLNANYKPRH
ncbi:hypothetical protein MFLAVUS_003707 [Mucor flavus]|uniref:Letm1 RBD domain-containing protein n=1 Tax=Mucor flavus TaxID=439312 RepID=A0ABP9YTU9_9FUNG